jgi:outer membrane protein TolC
VAFSLFPCASSLKKGGRALVLQSEIFARRTVHMKNQNFGRWLAVLALPMIGALAEDSGKTFTAATNLLSLEQVVNEVSSNNSSLKAARANWEAMKQRIPQARAWEDLRGGVDVERRGTTRLDTFTDNEWMVAQELPLSGKNRKRGQVAVAEAAAAFEEYRRRELELTARARAACYRLANAYEQLAVNRKNEELLKQFLGISRAKYEVGKQSQADVLVAETDLGKLLETRYDVERQISEEQSRLNVLMNRPAQAPLGRPAGLAFFPIELSLDHLQAMALAHRPELLAAQRKIEAAQARVDLAKREWIPDPEIRVEARQFNGNGGGIQEYDTGLFFKIPWLNRKKYKAAIAEAQSMKESAEHELEALRKETLGMVRDQLKKIETFHHHTELFRDRIVPLAQQAVKANQAAYETDKAGFLDLIVAQRTALDAESMYWSHLTDYLVAVAELEPSVGADPKRQTGSPAK